MKDSSDQMLMFTYTYVIQEIAFNKLSFSDRQKLRNYSIGNEHNLKLLILVNETLNMRSWT